MGNILSGSEVIEAGIQIEKNGRDFYGELTKNSKNQKARDVFKYLAVEEERHIAVFQKILVSAQKTEPAESYPGEYFAYLNALAGDYVFTQKGQGKEIAARIKADKEAVSLGIVFEKDSILFYEGMKKVIPEYDLNVIEELIRQEQGHLRKLADLKKEL